MDGCSLTNPYIANFTYWGSNIVIVLVNKKGLFVFYIILISNHQTIFYD